MFRQQPMPMMQNGLIGQTQQEAPENVLNVGGGAPKQTLQYESEPLRGGIGSLGASSVGEQMGSGQFGQMGSGQYGNASSKSLEQVLAERGFEMPEMPTGMQNAMQSLFKDPITGEYRTGGSHEANHAYALTDFYGENPEALEIAKQYNTDPTQFGDEPPQIRTRGPESLAAQGVFGIPMPMQQPINQLNSMQQFVSNTDKETSSPQYQALVKRNEESRGQDKDALGQLKAYNSRFETQLSQIDPVQQQQYAQSTALSGTPPLMMPDMSLKQQMQPPPSPMQQPPPSPMQQPQYSQQDMQGMMGLMIQMFQKAMQNSGGQSNYNAGSFGGNNMQFQQPQYAPPPPQPMTGRQRFLKNSGNSPFGQY